MSLDVASLEVVAAGAMVTVQDRGRFGLAAFGVSGAGPMDPPAFALANALVGNPEAAAGLEFAASGGRFRVSRPVRFAVTGGACDLRIEGRRLEAGQTGRLLPGETLVVGALERATWGYLALAGGIATPPVLGARTTHLRAGLGGLEGRALRAGDRLPLGPDRGPDVLLRPATAAPAGAGPIRVLLGPQADHFAADVRERFLGTAFVVTPQRDRMAMILDGATLPAVRGHDIVSDGVVPGAIQVPGSGRPVVLMAECQTTGGYPKIAVVIGADLPRLAQMPTGAALRFAAVGREEAEDALVAHRRALRERIAGLVARPEGMFGSEYLLGCDLVGGIFAPEEVVWSRERGGG